ncbi:relaxase/mobilization nuclease domain-containing protein [Geobacter sulfurreducens]|uniref:relaxase/mobilization nuclease domain-containing protein n=1 Tax=Geobacter sulfurreducens TaxID=35554 RepID=UPI0032B55F88
MIGNQTKGRGFRGVLDYILTPGKGILLGGNMDGKTPRELAKEFAESRSLNPDLQRPVYHVSLSLSPGEHVDDFTWNEIADRYIQRIGFGSSQYVVARHTDRENHEHIHIVASRIGLDGKTVSDSNDYYRSEQVIRAIEKEFGLERVLSSHERDIEDQKKALSAGELHKALETGTPNVKMVLQNHVDVAATHSVTMTDFVKHLERQGVQVIPNMADNGRVSGLSYRIDGKTVKGSKLGKAYTFNGVQKRGISYDLDRDRGAFALARAKAGVKPAVTKEPEKAPQQAPSHAVQQTVSQLEKAVVRDARAGGGVKVRIHDQELDR